jgi:small subunit ribosomal protein S1
VVVVGVNPETYELKLSIKRFEELENKKQVQKYLKSAPKLTLGQILENNETEEQ